MYHCRVLSVLVIIYQKSDSFVGLKTLFCVSLTRMLICSFTVLFCSLTHHLFYSRFSSVLTRTCLYLCAPWPSPLCRVLSISSSPATDSWFADAQRQEPTASACVWQTTSKGQSYGCYLRALGYVFNLSVSMHVSWEFLNIYALLLCPFLGLQTMGACWRSAM